MLHKQDRNNETERKTELTSTNKNQEQVRRKLLDDLIGIIKEGQDMDAVKDKHELYNQ